MTIGPIWRYNSGQTYSLFSTAVPLSAIQLARNPGYARLPGGGTQTLYYGDRGIEDFEGYGLVDLAATYEIPLLEDGSAVDQVRAVQPVRQQQAD